MSLLRTLFFVGLVSVFMPIWAGGATSVELPDGTKDLQQRLQSLNSLSARFSQTIYAVDDYIIQETSGHLQMARPGKVRWISDAPMEQWVIADGETLWIYDPDLEQVSIRAFQKNLEKTPAVLFVGNLDTLSTNYKILLETVAENETYTLLPLDKESLYTKLTLSFDGENPDSMNLYDTLGQRTEILFFEQQINPSLDKTLFTFEPPEGVDILRDE